MATALSFNRDWLALITSMLDNIPTYIMYIFPTPRKVLSQLDKIRRSFPWKGNSQNHDFHLAKWAKVIQTKLKGGPGIKNLAKHNKSMLITWL